MTLKGHEMGNIYAKNKFKNAGPEIESPQYKIYRV
jgi:hypothetical protein